MIRVSRPLVEWRLLATAVIALGAAVLLTKAFPYRVWRRRAHATLHTAPPIQTRATPYEIARAIDGASRVVLGGANCLARALAARRLMARHGWPSELVLGVAKGLDGRLRSHAWLRHDGNTLLGEQGVHGFVPMPDLAGRL